MDNKQIIFEERMNKTNPNIKIIGSYTRAKDKIEVECLTCGHIWNPTPHKLLCGRGCPKCANKTRKRKLRKSHEDFINDVHKINPNIKVISKYVNSSNYVELECQLCNHRWLAKPGNILSGKGCHNCSHIATGNRCRKKNEQFLKELSLVNKRVKVLDDYINNTTKLQVECLVCGHRWMAAPHTLLINKGCPICSSSKGETKIFDYLTTNSVNFIYQKSFDGLIGVGGNLLSYDFYLPDYKMLIEYQGVQHSKPIDFKGLGLQNAEKNLKIQKEHDKRKKQYAIDNGIELLEIWYFDFDNIEQILEEKLKGRRVRYA